MKTVYIIGARGYSGQQLTQLLARHPKVKIEGLFASEEFKSSDLLPHRGSQARPILPPGQSLKSLSQSTFAPDFVFLATPHETSWEWAPKFLDLGATVIDISGAFRLKGHRADELYAKYYRGNPPSPELLETAIYGLQPLCKIAFSQASQPSTLNSKPLLVANPGCYASAVILGLAPLLADRLISPKGIVVDAKSGTTGAGKKPLERLLASEVDGLCLPYRVGNHQHLPEIQQALARAAYDDTERFSEVDITFTPHLMPFRRGIIASIYADRAPGTSALAIGSSLKKFYGHDPLIEIVDLSDGKNEHYLNLRHIVNTAKTLIGYMVQGEKVLVFSLIDNLMKGAASQAVENLNLLLGLDSSFGLIEMEPLV